MPAAHTGKGLEPQVGCTFLESSVGLEDAVYRPEERPEAMLQRKQLAHSSEKSKGSCHHEEELRTFVSGTELAAVAVAVAALIVAVLVPVSPFVGVADMPSNRLSAVSSVQVFVQSGSAEACPVRALVGALFHGAVLSYLPVWTVLL